MQQIDAHQPVGVTPKHAAPDPHRWNARDVGAVAEGGPNQIELIFDAPDAAMEGTDIKLALEFAAAEGGVALRVDRLLQFKRGCIGGIDARCFIAGTAGQPAEDEAIE